MPNFDISLTNKAYWLISITLILFAVQVILGTQVRESVDIVASKLGSDERASWVKQLGIAFYIHRSYSILVFAIHAYFAFIMIKLLKGNRLNRYVYVLIAFLLFEILTGIIMYYSAIPPFFQPIHLILATLIFGIDFYLWLGIQNFRRTQLNAVAE